MKKRRLQHRKLKLWSQDYLVYRYLWPNIEQAVHHARSSFLGCTPTVLDIGCGHKPYRDLFGTVHYLGVDHDLDDCSPDIVAEAGSLPVRTASVDIVFSTQVIEHVPRPHKMLEECSRVLKPGGILVLTGPFYWPLHEEPFDFYRFTKYGFAQLLKDASFQFWEINEDGGDWAQLMLTICLRLRRNWMAPLRCVINIAGAVLDRAVHTHASPSNYTVIATR